MGKVISLKALQYEKMYKTFYADVRNKEFSKHCFMTCDVVNKTKTG